MPLKEQQDLLAKLYTDPEIQEAYFADANAVLELYGIRDGEAEAFSALADIEVRFFAESLLAKRFREVQKLLPTSSKLLGPKFREYFVTFASNFNPTSVKKHTEDAIAFAQVLISQREMTQVQQDTISFESARLRHFADERKISFVRLRHDPRGLADPSQEVQHQSGIGVWITSSKQIRFTFIKLPFL